MTVDVSWIACENYMESLENGDGNWRGRGLLVLGGLVVEAKFINMYVDIRKCDIGAEDDSYEIDKILIIKGLKELEKGIMAISPKKKNIIYEPKPEIRLTMRRFS